MRRLCVFSSRQMLSRAVQTRATLPGVSARQSRLDDTYPSCHARVLPPLAVAGGARAWCRRRMPFCAYVFRICFYRDSNTRSVPRHRARNLASVTLPSVLPRGPRSGTNRYKEPRTLLGNAGFEYECLGSFASRTVTIERVVSLWRATSQRQEVTLARNS